MLFQCAIMEHHDLLLQQAPAAGVAVLHAAKAGLPRSPVSRPLCLAIVRCSCDSRLPRQRKRLGARDQDRGAAEKIAEIAGVRCNA